MKAGQKGRLATAFFITNIMRSNWEFRVPMESCFRTDEEIELVEDLELRGDQTPPIQLRHR